MFRYIALLVIVGCAMAHPEPEAKATPEAKAVPNPGLIAPIVAPAAAYSVPLGYSAYSSSLVHSAYGARVISPYAAAYSVYSPYAGFPTPVFI